MTKRILLISLLFAKLSAQAQIEYSDDFGLQGEVKHVKLISYPLSFIVAIDKKGNLVEQGKPSGFRTLSFNTKKMLTKEYEIARNLIKTNNTFIYNDEDSLIDILFDGRVARERYYNMLKLEREKTLMTIDGRLETIKYSSYSDKNIYDSKGRLVKKFNTKIPNSKWRQQATCDFFYDGEKIDSIRCYDFENKLMSTHRYVYHNKLLTNEIILNFQDDSHTRTILSFNENGIVFKDQKERIVAGQIKSTEIKEYSSFILLKTTKLDSLGNTTYEETSVYDANKNLISHRIISNKFERVKRYTYDDHSNLLAETEKLTSSNDSTQTNRTYKYKYDSNKNWIIKCSCKDGSTYLATTRDIDYHNANSSNKVTKEEAISFCDADYFNRLEILKKEVKDGAVEKEGRIKIEERKKE